MVRNILLNCDEEFFCKMKVDKQRRETRLRANTKHKNLKLTWEEYVKLLFGFRKFVK